MSESSVQDDISLKVHITKYEARYPILYRVQVLPPSTAVFTYGGSGLWGGHVSSLLFVGQSRTGLGHRLRDRFRHRRRCRFNGGWGGGKVSAGAGAAFLASGCGPAQDQEPALELKFTVVGPGEIEGLRA